MEHTHILPAPPPSPVALAAVLLSYPREHLAALTEALTTALDVIDGDPDLEPAGDEKDAAWIEWHALAPAWRRGPLTTPGHEDDEESDDDSCAAADDHGSAGGQWFDSDGLPGDDADTELNGDEGDYGGEVDGV